LQLGRSSSEKEDPVAEIDAEKEKESLWRRSGEVEKEAEKVILK